MAATNRLCFKPNWTKKPNVMAAALYNARKRRKALLAASSCISVVSVLDQDGNEWLVLATALNSLGAEFIIPEDALDSDGNTYTITECLGSRSLGLQLPTSITADSTVVTADSTTITADAT